MMTVEFLSRLQFAMAAGFHFLFVPLTLGLGFIVAIMETLYVRSGQEHYRRMTRFWGRLFVLNFGIGVVTGLTLEFQFGTNWARYSRYVGDIFGSLLAIEATLAFFLESSFLGIWIFGWKRVSPRLHAACIWIVALASLTSAYWILAANAWMQNPVGYVIRDGRAELTDFFALITQSAAVISFLHTVIGAFTLSGFFVMAVSAWHLLKKQHEDIFQPSFKIGLIFATLFAFLTVGTGHLSGGKVAQLQPAKLAAMESHWETKAYAPQILFVIPDEKNERNLVEFIRLRPLLSILAYKRPSASMTGLLDFPKEDRPPVTIVFFAFRIMVGLGFLFVALAVLGWILPKKSALYPLYLHGMIYAVVLPYLALQCGWIVTEVGRQPWIVYGLMRTSEAASPIAFSQVAVSFLALFLLYALIGLIAFYLLIKMAARGPEPAPEPLSPPSGDKESAHA